MGSFNWVMSAGGALICLEDRSAHSWGGILRLSVQSNGATNDYERTYPLAKYLEALQIQGGTALILGQGPLDTSFWKSGDDKMFIIQIDCCEADAGDEYFDRLMGSLDRNLFDNSIEVNDFSIASSPLIMFDSANDGSKIGDKVVSVEIEPGRYRVLTQTYDPDPTCSLVLHRFDRLP